MQGPAYSILKKIPKKRRAQKIEIIDKNQTVEDIRREYSGWIKRAPLNCVYLLVVKSNSGDEIPYYIMEKKNLQKELNHFGPKIKFLIDLSIQD